MKLLYGFSRGLKKINNQLLDSFLTFVIPRYGKRMIYIVGVFTVLGGKNAKDHELLCRLNKLMHLCQDDRALDFSAIVGNKALSSKNIDALVLEICHGRQITDGVKIDEAKLLAKYIIEKTPNWLKYDSEEKMTYDTERAVLSAGRIPGCA